MRGPGHSWPRASSIETERLLLDPLRVDDADPVAAALDDVALHAFIGGAPASAAMLRARFTRQVVGAAPDGSAGWLNWVVRDRATGAVLGTVQATVRHAAAEGPEAEVAWVIATGWQGRGIASEAAVAMADWLREQGVGRLIAHVHPLHHASGGVARRIGLEPTEAMVDGERRWATPTRGRTG